MLITGATDGIGLALARRLHAAGTPLLLHGRRSAADVAAVDPAMFATVSYIQADLARPDAPARIAAQLEGQRPGVVVHNAAAAWYGQPDRQSASSIREMMEVNLQAPAALTHALLPRLAPGGRILFVGSVAARLPVPEYAVYGATKAGLEGLARSLHGEKGGIAVQVVSPGATATGLHAKAGIPQERMDWERFPAADVVAQRIQQAMASRRFTTVPGGGNRLLRAVGHNLAPLLDPLIARRRGRPPARGTAAGAGPAEERQALVTGGAAGIGGALTSRLAAAGYRVVIVDCDEEAAELRRREVEADGGRAEVLLCDLRDRGQRDRLLAALDRQPLLDLLVHNAVINHVAAFAAMTAVAAMTASTAATAVAAVASAITSAGRQPMVRPINPTTVIMATTRPSTSSFTLSFAVSP